ncbi:MAG: hypothetical protein JWQ43_3975 [Glaciihabitans sp.]|nr:hypothetical protein [Glaciihabitans sp.]
MSSLTPAPQPTPSVPVKVGPTGTLPLVFGILLLFIGLFPALRSLFSLIRAVVVMDAYTFGSAIGSLIVTAIFVVPGILLIRRSNRARLANRTAITNLQWELAQPDSAEPATAQPATPWAEAPQPTTVQPETMQPETVLPETPPKAS